MPKQRVHFRLFIFRWMMVFSTAVWVASVSAAPLIPDHRLADGVVINEVLADPSVGADGCSAGVVGVDINSDGCINQADEFVELYNGLDEAVEMPNWSLWTNDGELVFTFPEDAEIEAYGYVLITAEWDPSLQDEISTLNGADVYSVDRPEGMLLDDGDNIVLLDPDFEEYIHAYYTGDGAGQTEPIDVPLNDYAGFVEDGDQIGEVSDFGLMAEGVSRVRVFSGDKDILTHTDVDGEAASPGNHYTAVTLQQIVTDTAASRNLLSMTVFVFLTLATCFVFGRQFIKYVKIKDYRK